MKKKTAREIMLDKVRKYRDREFMHDQLVRDLADYIVDDDNEADDFYEYPSETHVYYKALVLQMGRVYADKILKDAIEDQINDRRNV